MIVCLAVLVELRLVTDTDRQTDTDGHRPMASTADAWHRAVKTVENNLDMSSTNHYLRKASVYFSDAYV